MAVRRQRICAKPSNRNAKFELSVPSHDAENSSASAFFTKPFPAIASANVKNEINNAQLRTVRSLFKKNESNPPISGTKNSNKTIILKSKFKSQNVKARSQFLTFYFLIFTSLERIVTQKTTPCSPPSITHKLLPGRSATNASGGHHNSQFFLRHLPGHQLFLAQHIY